MIGRVYRGSRVGGLVRYLFGPGRANEHENAHLVATWEGDQPHELASLEPSGEGVENRGCGRLIAELEAPLRYAPHPQEMVWHCPIRTAPGDRVLTDAEWGEVAADLMHRTGIAPRGDAGACRWIAVRHDEYSVHVAAVLARQDGANVRLWRDYFQVRETCLEAEKRYGLAVTAPADGTAAKHTTRGEVEKAQRTGQSMPARDWLREQVQHAAVASREPGEFLDRLRAYGVVVIERHDSQGKLAGYAVGRREEGASRTIMFGGGKLAADLTLPKLQARWASADVTLVATDRRELWARATEAASSAAEQVRAQQGSDPDAGGDAAAAAAEVLSAASRLIEGQDGGPLTDAARAYDRAAREAYRRQVESSQAGQVLRAVAYAMARSDRRRPGRTEAAQVAVLVFAVARLSASVARLRETQGRPAQAGAARQAAQGLAEVTDAWSGIAKTAPRSVAATPARAVAHSTAVERGRRM